MGWWPFKKSNGKDEVKLEPDLQQYYESIVAEEGSTPPQAAPSLPPTLTSAREAPPTPAGRSQVKTLKQIAMDNCVEYEKAYSTCLLRGSYFERLAGCPTQMSMYEQCQSMQTEALTVLEFAKAQSDAERRAIKARADDLMIHAVPSLTITNEQADAFTKSLDSIRGPEPS